MRYVSSCVGYHELNPVTRECKHCFASAKLIYAVEGVRGTKTCEDFRR